MTRVPDAGPSATLTVLRHRAEMLHWVRDFFREHGYWEVQTPVLSHDVCVDAWLEPFQVPVAGPGGTSRQEMYLQTSPEFAMKRLLASGAEAIFQITPAFRVGEAGLLHNPEFTMVEWYRTGDTYRDQMTFTEAFTAEFLNQAQKQIDARSFHQASLSRPFPRLTYEEAFREVFGENVLDTPTSELRRWAEQQSLTLPESLTEEDRDGWLNFLLAEAVEPRLAERPAVFIYDYPSSQAALARIRPDDPPVAERFELYLQGLEICNGYQELTDADELRRRIVVQSRLRAAAGLPPLPSQSRLLAAMESGLPECSGVALGFDRLLMIGLGLSTMEQVLAFPFDRA